MAKYLNRERMRVVERNEKGQVTYRKRYVLGDKVDTSHLEDVHIDNLVRTGVLVDSKDKVTGWRGLGRPGSGAAVTEAPADEAEEDQEAQPEAPLTPVNEDPETTAAPEDLEVAEDEAKEVDQYDDLDYATLQHTAKNRDLNAGGSAADLRARLREADAASA